MNKKIKLKDGWNPGFKSGTKVKALRTFWTIMPGDVVTYKGGCDHPCHGWEIFFSDSDITVSGRMFEDGFEIVEEVK